MQSWTPLSRLKRSIDVLILYTVNNNPVSTITRKTLPLSRKDYGNTTIALSKPKLENKRKPESIISRCQKKPRQSFQRSNNTDQSYSIHQNHPIQFP